jgi:hypothetical protein
MSNDKKDDREGGFLVIGGASGPGALSNSEAEAK